MQKAEGRKNTGNRRQERKGKRHITVKEAEDSKKGKRQEARARRQVADGSRQKAEGRG